MIGLSVAVGRFVEALFWAIFRVAGGVAVAAVVGLLILLVGYAGLRRLLKRR